MALPRSPHERRVGPAWAGCWAARRASGWSGSRPAGRRARAGRCAPASAGPSVGAGPGRAGPMPSGSPRSTRALVVSDRSTWPPCPAAAMPRRAVHVETDVVAAEDRFPVCRPMRTRTHRPWIARCQASAASSRCAPRSSPTAVSGLAKTTKKKRRPRSSPHAASAPMAVRMQRARGARGSSGSGADPVARRVDPSMSVNRKVTVPVGRLGMGRTIAPARSSDRARS